MDNGSNNINTQDFQQLLTYIHKYKSNKSLNKYYHECMTKFIDQMFYCQITSINEALEYSKINPNRIIKIQNENNNVSIDKQKQIELIKLNTESLRFLSINNNYFSFPFCPKVEELYLNNIEIPLKKKFPFKNFNIKKITLSIKKEDCLNYEFFLAQMVNLKTITIFTVEPIQVIQTILGRLHNPKLQQINLVYKYQIISTLLIKKKEHDEIDLNSLMKNFPKLTKVSQSYNDLNTNDLTQKNYDDSFSYVINEDFLYDFNMNIHTKTKILENYLKKDYHSLLLQFKDDSRINEFIQRFMHSKIIMSRIREVKYNTNLMYHETNLHNNINNDNIIWRLGNYNDIKIGLQKRPIRFQEKAKESRKRSTSAINCIEQKKNKELIINGDNYTITHIYKINMMVDTSIYHKVKHATVVIIPYRINENMKKIVINLDPSIIIIIIKNKDLFHKKNIEWLNIIAHLKFVIYNHQLQMVKRNNAFIDI